MDRNDRWTVKSHGSVYIITLPDPTTPAEWAGLHLPTAGVIADWLESVSERRTVAAMSAAGLASRPRRDLVRLLAAAFRDRRLICRRAGSYRIPVHPHPWPEPPAPPPPPPPPPERPRQKATTWLAIELVDDRGQPVAGQLCRVVLPDGSRQEHRLDGRGLLVVEDIAPGTCEVSFPDTDEREWESA